MEIIESLRDRLRAISERIAEQEAAVAGSEVTTSEVADKNNAVLELTRLHGERDGLERQIAEAESRGDLGWPLVTVENTKTGEVEKFIVAPLDYESEDEDIIRVTPESPIGLALKGSKKGSKVELPYGTVKVTDLVRC